MIKTAMTAISRDTNAGNLEPIMAAAAKWENLTARVALDNQVREDAYRLRYQSYLSANYIEPNPEERFTDPYDTTLAATTLVLYTNGRPIGSVRGLLEERDAAGEVTSVATPGTKLFPEEMRALFATQSPHPVRRAMELTRLVRHPEYATDPLLVFALFRMACCLALQQGADAATCVVRRNHMPFYRRMQFEKRSEPMPYPGLKFDAGLMACFRGSYDKIRTAFPLLDVADGGRETYIRLMEGGRVPVFPRA